MTTTRALALTAEQREVLTTIDRTGNPDDSHLHPTAVATAMIWLHHHRRITVEQLPHHRAPRSAWLDYAHRLHVELPPPPVTVHDIRLAIGSHRLWTTA